MFVDCRKCKYMSDDRDTREELSKLVESQGGQYGNGVHRCPKCGHDELVED